MMSDTIKRKRNDNKFWGMLLHVQESEWHRSNKINEVLWFLIQKPKNNEALYNLRCCLHCSHLKCANMQHSEYYLHANKTVGSTSRTHGRLIVVCGIVILWRDTSLLCAKDCKSYNVVLPNLYILFHFQAPQTLFSCRQTAKTQQKPSKGVVFHLMNQSHAGVALLVVCSTWTLSRSHFLNMSR